MAIRTDPRVDFRVFGQLRFLVDGREVPVPGRNPKIVLAVLVCSRGRLVTPSALSDAIWGPTPPPNSRNNIQAAVSKVRASLQNAGLDPLAVLPGSPAGYALVVDSQESDVGRFHALSRHANQRVEAGDLEAAAKQYAEALAEVDAPLSDLSDNEFAQTFSREMDRAIVDVTIRWARVEADLGRPERVMSHLRAVAAEHPQNEPLQYETIRLLYLAGMQAEALETYHALKDWLDENQGIDPAPHTQELYRRILNQETLGGAKSVAVSAVSMTDIGIDTTQPRYVPAVLVDEDGNEIPIPPGTLRIGRDVSNHLVLPDRRVSARHASIKNAGRGFVITDENSTNGTYVQGQPVLAPMLLTDGDVIQLGSMQFTFRVRLDRS